MQTPDDGDEPHETYGLSALRHFVYCSRAAPGIDKAEVDRIIAVSQRHNPLNGVTGLLVFGGGVFFQWLEGPRESILALVQRLHADPRHDTIITLDESEEVRERMFPDWAMELVNSDDIREVLADAHDNAENDATAQALHRMLEQIDRGELGFGGS
jgi:hypothetical protein